MSASSMTDECTRAVNGCAFELFVPGLPLYRRMEIISSAASLIRDGGRQRKQAQRCRDEAFQ
jgi:hypothetical protein